MARVRVLVVVVGLGVALGARAAPGEGPEVQRAKALFAEGRVHYDASRYREAIAAYQAAYELAPLPLLLFDIGLAQQRAGDLAAARRSFRRYLAVEPSGDVAVEARTRIGEIEAVLGSSDGAVEPPASPEPPAPAAPRAPPATTPPLTATLTVPPPRERPPLVRRWWLWTSVGVALALASGGVALGLVYGRQPPAVTLGHLSGP